MRGAVILALTHLILAACAPEGSANAPQTLEGFGGQTIVFRSNVNRSVVALHLDAGAYRNYANVSEVGGESDIGDTLAPCGEGISKCVEFAHLVIMVPSPGGSIWNFGGYDFAPTASLDGEGQVVVVSRNGEESYSYSYSPRCGVEWINFSAGREQGKEVFYPVGRSLFSKSACRPSPVT